MLELGRKMRHESPVASLILITQYVSLRIFHSTMHTAPPCIMYTFLSIFISELVHELVLLLFYARFLLILASTALRRIQFLLILFPVYLFSFPQSFGTRKIEVRYLNTCLLTYELPSFVLSYINTLSIVWNPKD